MLWTRPFLAMILAAAPVAAADSQRPTGEAALQKALAGRVQVGEPVSCILLLPTARGGSVIPGTAVIYNSGGRMYVNRPRTGAEDLTDDVILVSRTPTNQLCRDTTVDLVDRFSRISRGFLQLGDFVPYARPRNGRAR